MKAPVCKYSENKKRKRKEKKIQNQKLLLDLQKDITFFKMFFRTFAQSVVLTFSTSVRTCLMMMGKSPGLLGTKESNFSFNIFSYEKRKTEKKKLSVHLCCGRI
jgi:hypothetical protein